MEELIKYDDESIERYVQMAKSEDESVRELLLTILENNFDYKYSALYVYLLKYMVKGFAISDYPKLGRCLKHKLSKNGFLGLRQKTQIKTLSLHSFHMYNVKVLDTIKTIIHNDEDELFSPCAIKIIEIIVNKRLNEEIIGLKRFQCNIEISV
jgi:hypothetical protein